MAEWVKRLRDHAGMTQLRLAVEVDVSLATIGRWEQGQSQPDKHSVRALARLARKKGFTEPMPQ